MKLFKLLSKKISTLSLLCVVLFLTCFNAHAMSKKLQLTIITDKDLLTKRSNITHNSPTILNQNKTKLPKKIKKLETQLLDGFEKQNLKTISTAIKKYKKIKTQLNYDGTSLFDRLFQLAIENRISQDLFMSLLKNVDIFKNNLNYDLNISFILKKTADECISITIKKPSILHALQCYNFFIRYPNLFELIQKNFIFQQNNFKIEHTQTPEETLAYLKNVDQWVIKSKTINTNTACSCTFYNSIRPNETVTKPAIDIQDLCYKTIDAAIISFLLFQKVILDPKKFPQKPTESPDQVKYTKIIEHEKSTK
ncbi:MAG: hypothetical protein ABH827_04990 [bacterium]